MDWQKIIGAVSIATLITVIVIAVQLGHWSGVVDTTLLNINNWISVHGSQHHKETK